VSVGDETDAWTQTPMAGVAITRRWSGRRRVITLAAIVLLAAIAAYLLAGDESAYVRRLSLTVLLLTLICQVVAQLLWNGAMLLPLRTYMKLGYWELFMVRAGGALASNGIPVAGNIGVRLAYLKRRGLTYSDFTWATITSSILALAAGTTLAVIALGVLWMVAGSVSHPVAGLTVGVAVLTLAGLAALAYLPRLAGHPRFRTWGWLSGVSRHEASRRTMIAIAALAFGRHFFNFLAFGLLYQSLLRAPGGFLAGGLVYAITSPIRMVTLTPGNLGVNEWATAAVGKLLSFDLTTGLIVALVFRGLSFAAQALGVFAVATWWTLRGEP
jgi:Lysylphosphatidylglycerol synthase TM region